MPHTKRRRANLVWVIYPVIWRFWIRTTQRINFRLVLNVLVTFSLGRHESTKILAYFKLTKELWSQVARSVVEIFDQTRRSSMERNLLCLIQLSFTPSVLYNRLYVDSYDLLRKIVLDYPVTIRQFFSTTSIPPWPDQVETRSQIRNTASTLNDTVKPT